MIKSRDSKERLIPDVCDLESILGNIINELFIYEDSIEEQELFSLLENNFILKVSYLTQLIFFTARKRCVYVYCILFEYVNFICL